MLPADASGYLRLTGADEIGTLAAWTRHRRDIVDPAIAQRAGRIVKTTGDVLPLLMLWTAPPGARECQDVGAI